VAGGGNGRRQRASSGSRREKERGVAHHRPTKEGTRGAGEGDDGERGRPMVGKGPLRRRWARLLERPREGGMGREGERERRRWMVVGRRLGRWPQQRWVDAGGSGGGGCISPSIHFTRVKERR